MSKISNSEKLIKEEEKTFYIFFFFSKTKEENIEFNFGKEKTKKIFFTKLNNKGIFRYIVILKHEQILTKDNEIELSFKNKKESGESYIIKFKYDDSTFIFNPSLKIRKNRISNEKNINQINVIGITEKIDYFAKCLLEIKENKENKELKTLYKDGINFFKINHNYELIIYLFIKMSDNYTEFLYFSMYFNI